MGHHFGIYYSPLKLIHQQHTIIIGGSLVNTINNIKNIEFICSDAKEMKKKSFDTIIVDPPRNGLSGDVVNYLINSKAKSVCVGCAN